MLKWTEKFRTGVPVIDSQHQKLFECFNNFHEAMLRGVSLVDIGDVLNFLSDYTVEHFQTEEKLMEEHAYPGLAAHKADHAKLIVQVRRLQKDHREGKLVWNLELSELLNEWIAHHIDETDRGYIPWFREKGVAL